jgi:hypothetical protein
MGVIDIVLLLVGPLVEPEVLAGTVPELAALIEPAALPPLAPELTTDGPLMRPPHAAMAKRANGRGDHRPRVHERVHSDPTRGS